MPTKHEMWLSDEVRASDHFSGTVVREGKVVGFIESLRDNRAAYGDLNRTGALDYGLIGQTSKGEQGALQTCVRLVRAINGETPVWVEPNQLSDLRNVDCCVARIDQTGSTLNIQVVRALTDQIYWHAVARDGRADISSISISDAALEIKKTIELKVAKIDVPDRASIVLALNAEDSPVLGFDAVVAEFRARHGIWASTLSFSDIWLIGPSSELTKKLT